MLNVDESDLAGLPLSVLAAMATIGSYYYLQPLGDVLALSMGIEWTPLVTVGNMVLIVALNPLYAVAVLNLSTEAILPFMYRIVSALLLLFACFFYFFSGVKTLSFCFSVSPLSRVSRGSARRPGMVTRRAFLLAAPVAAAAILMPSTL